MVELLKCGKCGGEIFYPRVRLRVAEELVKKVDIIRKIKGESGVPILQATSDSNEEVHSIVSSMNVLVCEACGTINGDMEGGETDENRAGN